MNFSFVHEFDIDVPSYWKMFLSDAFNVEMYADLKMNKREVLSQEDDGKIFRRTVYIEPSTSIPSWMQSVVKKTAYTEHDTLTWATNSMEVVIETEIMKDRFKMAGLYTVTPLDGGKRCRREFKGEVKVAIPLIGGRVEKYMMEQVRDSYDVASRVTRRWIANGGPSAPAKP